MNNTVYEHAFETVLKEIIEKDKKILEVIYTYKKNIKNNFYKDEDFYHQSCFGWSDENILAFAYIHGHDYDGRLFSCAIELPENITPVNDKLEEENNKRLSLLPNGFSAKFISGTNDCDGWFKWDHGITLSNVDNHGKLKQITLNPSDCVLEVGYTTAVRTYFHLFEDKILARWPYGRNYIVLMALIDDKISEVKP